MDPFTKFKRPEKVYETVDKEKLTERAGYVPAAVQIQQFLQAGKKLNEFRKEMYDYVDDEMPDMELTDPTRERSLDLAEAFELGQIAKENLQNSLAEAKKLKQDVVENQPVTAEKV